jgi:hypothetical protein
MNADFDLNIENYSLEDLLNLFKLSVDFSEVELKNAKKYIYKLHPDKSNLPKEYFIFFAKAYKYIYQIHEFKRRKNSENTVYENIIEDDSSSDVYNILSKTKSDQFHKWFNEMFDKYNLKEEDAGYDEWLKEEDNVSYDDASNANQLQQSFDKYKTMKMRDIVVHKGIEDTCNNLSCGGSVVNKKRMDDYSSTDIFNTTLNYNDVRKAHSESFIPITKEDIDRRKSYNNEMELNIERSEYISIPSREQSNKYMDNKRIMEEEMANKDAYELLLKHEKQERLNQLFLKDLRLLK